MAGCDKYRGDEHNLSFFHCPKDPELSRRWIVRTREKFMVDKLAKGKTMSLNNFVFCSQHFERDMFMDDKMDSLASYAVPTLLDMVQCSSCGETFGEWVMNKGLCELCSKKPSCSMVKLESQGETLTNTHSPQTSIMKVIHDGVDQGDDVQKEICQVNVKTEPTESAALELINAHPPQTSSIKVIDDIDGQKRDGPSEICEANVKTEPAEIADLELENRNHEKSILGP